MDSKNQDIRKSLKLQLTWIVIFCIFDFYTALAQDAVTMYSDSLLDHARKAPTTELKIEELLNVSIFWIDYDTIKAYQYLEEARRFMDEPPTAYQKGLYHLYYANILMDFEPQKAKDKFSMADSLLAKNKSPKSYLYRSKLWNNYGVVLQKEDKSAEFMEVIVYKTIPYARLAGDSAQVGYQLQNVAMLLSNQSNYQKADNYYKQALKATHTVHNRKEERLDIFINAARNALLMKEELQARTYLDSAKLYVQGFSYSTISIPAYYRTELTYYKHIGDKQKVIENYEEGVLAAEKTGNTYMLKDLSFELSTFYKDLGAYEEARKYLLLSNTYQPYSRLQNKAIYQREMAELEYLLGNYKRAYRYMDSLRITKDSIYQRDVNTKLLEFEQQYKTTEKENRILRLETKNKQQELAIAKNRGWGLVLTASLVFAVLLAYFLWRIGKNNKKLFTQKELLHEKELRAIRQKERLNQYDAMLQGQEAERNRMAKDLHDGLGGLLAGVKLKLSFIVTRTSGDHLSVGSDLNDVVDQLDYSVDELRRIAHDMMPESLRFGGLAPALSDLCRYMSSKSVQVVFQDLGIKDHYPDQLHISLYRVIQELLANAIKHANATKIIVQCSELDGWLFVTVEDNGKGMEQKEEKREKGLGLINIQNRISLLNGDIETLSKPNEGTTVNIQVPL